MNEELERCKPWIEAALEYSGGTHDFIDVAEGIYKGYYAVVAYAKGVHSNRNCGIST